MTDEMTGGCACGKVRYTARVHDDDAYLCHCRMCQRTTGGVSIAFKNMKKADVSWRAGPTGTKLADRPAAVLQRLRHVARLRIPRRRAYGPHDRLVRRSGAVPADASFRVESMHRQWLNTEGLPERRTEDYKPLVERWMEKVGKLPD